MPVQSRELSGLGGGPPRQPLQRRFRFLGQPGFGSALSEGLQDLLRFRRADVFEHFHRTQRSQ